MSELGNITATLEYIKQSVDDIKNRLNEKDKLCQLQVEKIIHAENKIDNTEQAVKKVWGLFWGVMIIIVSAVVSLAFKNIQG